jgi:hypothetical protein
VELRVVAKIDIEFPGSMPGERVLDKQSDC